MQRRCATCGGTVSDGKRIQTFTELGFGPGGEGGSLQLCSDCLDRRHAKRWEPGEQMTSRVLSVLEGTEMGHPQGRYSYLRDPDRGVHLVRLQNDWALSHAEMNPEETSETEPGRGA